MMDNKLSNIEKVLIDMMRRPVEKGDTVYILNGADQVVEHYHVLELSKAFFMMSNDDFYELYGFNYVPKGYWREKAILEVMGE